MPYPKIKAERYALMGGLNTKISRYDNGPQDLIRLVNYDHTVPGSLTKRPDTSAFIGTSFGTNLRTIYEQTYLNGASYRFVFGMSGSWAVGSTLINVYYGYSTAAFGNGIVTGGVTTPFKVSTINSNDNLWAANVIDVEVGIAYGRFVRFHATLGYFALGQMQIASSPANFSMATYINAASGFFTSGFGYRYNISLVNERGIVGPALPYWMRPYLAGIGATSVLLNIPGQSLSGYATKLYNNGAFGTLLISRETIGITACVTAKPDVSVTTAYFAVPVSAGVTTLLDDGSSSASFLMNPLSVNDNLKNNDYYRFDATRLVNAPLIPPADVVGVSTGIKNTGEPRHLSMLNNMMVFTGFSMAPSHVFWSEIGIPEWVANDSYNEIRTSDGDYVSGSIAYNNVVVIGKRRSIHEMSGTTPDDVAFSVQTTQYGFMNNFTQCIWNNTLWFIDGQGKGIGEYNGANTQIISTKVEDIFKRINLDAALDHAFMLHVKQRNEVWAGIPIDGSPLVNCIVVYDYVAQAWTTYEGLSPNTVGMMKGSLGGFFPVMGFSNGDIRYMNATYTGAEFMTTVVRFPFVTNFGWSTEQMYRRLFVDVDPVIGVTHAFTANFYLNAGNSAALSTSLNTSATQKRVDFGLSGKGLSVELIEGSTLATRVNGYTIESRFQRSV